MPRLLERIDALHPMDRRTRIVAIDGCGGSGKSTLADELASRRRDVAIVRTDDFYDLDASEWDWRRLEHQVLAPLRGDHPARYQRYDWASRRLAKWHEVPTGGILIVEGVSSMRAELGAYWDLAIWVECSYERRLERGIARDGESQRSQWAEVWMPREDEYVRRQQPQRRADLILSGEEPFPL
jgi:uridine kinase